MWAMQASIFLFKYYRLRRRHELLLGLIYLAFCVSFFVF